MIKGWIAKNKANVINWAERVTITTLALGSQPRQGLIKVRAKKEARESHLMFMGV